MAKRPSDQTTIRLIEDSVYALLICLIVYAVAVWQIRSYQSELNVQTITIPGDPVIPAISYGAQGTSSQPAVIIIHGLLSSKEMMQTLGLEVAKMGVAVYLFDFPGHGASTAAFEFDLRGDREEALACFRHLNVLEARSPAKDPNKLWPPRVDPSTCWGVSKAGLVRNTDRLTAYLERVYDYVREQHGGDAASIALVGHSMGSGVAMRFAMKHPEVKAVVSISPPFSGETDQSSPPNLLLLAGQWDAPQSVAGVREALAAATNGRAELGATYGDFSRGTARRAAILPRVDHIAIIFSPAAAREINHWLARALQVLYAVPTGIIRLLWLGAANLAAVVAAMLLVSPLHHLASRLPGVADLTTVVPLSKRDVAAASPATLSEEILAKPWRISLGTALGYLGLFAVASGLAVLFLSVRTPFTFLRLLIGDYLTSYFFVAGVLMFIIARLTRRDIPLIPWKSPATESLQGQGSKQLIIRQALRSLPVPVALFMLLFVLVGLLGTYTWAHFTPTTVRWTRFVPVFLLSLPFFVADEVVFRALQESSIIGSGLMSLLGKLIVLASLAAGVLLAPRNSVVILMLPLMLILFVLFQLFSLRIYHVTRSSLATAIFNTLLVAWIMVAIFPIT